MSRRLVVAGAVIGPWMGVKIAPGFGSAEEADALTDALMVPRRERREAGESAATGTEEVA